MADTKNNKKQSLKVALTTLGCKANQYDTSAIEDALVDVGHSLVPFTEHADAYIINTCTVTNRTDSQSRTLIRRVRKENAGATVIVTGCYATVSPEEIAKIEGVDYVVGNTGKDNLVDYINKGYQKRRAERLEKAEDEPKAAGASGGTPITLRTRSASRRTRATLKIQDGCSKACSYCIIPKARGTSRSVPIETVESEIEAFIKAGYKEVVLTGIHLGDYDGGRIKSSQECADITAVARLIETKGWGCRFRFSSLDPDEVTDAFIEILKSSSNICNHVHLPLQSGDDAILKKMNRQYRLSRFTDRIARLSEVPGIAIGTDIITGFPGETEEAFERTYRVLSGLPVSYLHIFPYSVRVGTPAASYPDALHGLEIKRRAAKLKELDISKRRAFYESNLSTVAEVLIERVEDGAGLGKTRNYIPVTVNGHDLEANTLISVLLEEISDGSKGMSGRTVLPTEHTIKTGLNIKSGVTS